MATIRSFRDLIAWQKGMDVVRETYRLSRCLPQDERFGLVSQMRRAAISVPANIAEGHGRSSTVDFLRFLDMSVNESSRASRGAYQKIERRISRYDQRSSSR